MDLDGAAGVVATAGGPIAWFLAVCGAVAGIAAWVGRGAAQVNEMWRTNCEYQQKRADAADKRAEAADERADAERKRAEQAEDETAKARAALARETERADMAEAAMRLAQASLAEATLRADTAEKVARAVEDVRGIPHRRTSDRPGDLA